MYSKSGVQRVTLSVGKTLSLFTLFSLAIVRNYKPKQEKPTNYEDIQAALELVQVKGYSVRKAAKEECFI